HFYNNDRSPVLKQRKRLKLFICELFKREKKELHAVTYIFCSDEYLLGINNEFLKHNFYTDVVTFDLGIGGGDIVGEVYISIDRVKDNARKLNTSFDQELHRVIFHAVLHLCGYEDKKPMDKKTMVQKEEFYLKRYFNKGST
ncbi:MAG: rRNA maturation RNase YbeY, partial [Flavisolibacter sp.]